jgi:hypothetical protein
MLVDLSKSEKEVIDSIRGTKSYSDRKFSDSYYELSRKISGVVEAAKIYILDNFRKIEDYSDLSLMLKCANHKGTVYIGKKETEETRKSKSGIIDKMLRELNEQTIEISSFDDAVYDWSDGDFSVKFNGIGYNWIDSYSIINIADYIEQKLDEKDKVLQEGK